LEIIKSRDIHGESNQFIVRSLFPSQILSHNNNNNNNPNNESIYLLNEMGDFIPSPSPLNGLVFECGEINLHQYLTKYSKVPILQKVNILEDIVNAVSFLHNLKIIHFDLKPENIVRFNNTNQGTRWKLIDFDSCFDLNINPTPRIIYPVNDENIRLTEEYVCPEVMKVIHNIPPYNSIEINDKMDIWSLGLISIFILKGNSLWKLLNPHKDFDISMILEFNDNILQRLLIDLKVGEKERSFIEGSLKIDPNQRLNCNGLKNRSLFETGSSTIGTNNMRRLENIESKVDNVQNSVNEARADIAEK